MQLNENSQTNWKGIIKEELGVTNQNRLNWMAQVAQVHAMNEARKGLNPLTEGLQTVDSNASQGIYSTPFNTLGAGNPMAPMGMGYNTTDGSGIGNTGSDFSNPNYKMGSGDIPMSTLNMALEVAAMTIGFDLVSIVPATGPWHMLSYFDTPYAGGKLGKINETSFDGIGPKGENKPIYVKFIADYEDPDTSKVVKGDEVTVTSDNGTITGTFIAFSRIDNGTILKVEEVKKGNEDVSIATVAKAEVTVKVGSSATAITSKPAKLIPELVSNAADHVQGFANFFDGSEEPMSRAQNETGVGNTIGARLQSKWIHMGGYEVTGSVTRQQLQDFPLYGIDVVGKVLESMQNEISQHINNRILDRVFKLGVTNAVIQKKYQGLDLNLTFDKTADTKALKDFTGASKFIGIDNKEHATEWGAVKVAGITETAGNSMTNQRRIGTRVNAALNMIGVVSRKGRGNWIVANSQIISALQDNVNFVVNPAPTTMVEDGTQSLYLAGTYMGANIYCEPNMLWNDTRVCCGRKSADSQFGQTGVVFMPYILCDTVQITAEGTMAPKLLCNSRFAIVSAGFHPEQGYLTFLIDGADADII